MTVNAKGNRRRREPHTPPERARSHCRARSFICRARTFPSQAAQLSIGHPRSKFAATRSYWRAIRSSSAGASVRSCFRLGRAIVARDAGTAPRHGLGNNPRVQRVYRNTLSEVRRLQTGTRPVSHRLKRPKLTLTRARNEPFRQSLCQLGLQRYGAIATR